MLVNALVIDGTTQLVSDLDNNVLTQVISFINATIQDRKDSEAAKLENEIAELTAKLSALKGGTETQSKTRVQSAKYRNPSNPNEVYGGHGKRPQWFVDALAMVQGDEDATNRVLDELKVKE